jgi:hypothetical protein
MARDHISQRDMMRKLVAELGHKRDAVCAAKLSISANSIFRVDSRISWLRRR